MPDNNELESQVSEEEKRRVIASFMSHFDSVDEDDDVEELDSTSTEANDFLSRDTNTPTTIILEDRNQKFDDIFSDF